MTRKHQQLRVHNRTRQSHTLNGGRGSGKYSDCHTTMGALHTLFSFREAVRGTGEPPANMTTGPRLLPNDGECTLSTWGVGDSKFSGSGSVSQRHKTNMSPGYTTRCQQQQQQQPPYHERKMRVEASAGEHHDRTAGIIVMEYRMAVCCRSNYRHQYRCLLTRAWCLDELRHQTAVSAPVWL
jgi:hypothetical protein